MKDSVITFINKLEGFKTAIKNLHWSSSNMSEHKLFDDIASSVSDIQDEVSEMEQGLHGQIEKNKLHPTSYTIEGSKKFLDDLKSETKTFYDSIDGDEYIGIRSSVESFLGEIDKYKYLMNLCLKEDFKRSYYKIIKEDVEGIPYPFDIRDTFEITRKSVFDSGDGYYDYEIMVDDWYTIRGTFDGDSVTYDELINGHSGHGRQVVIDDEIDDFLHEKLDSELISQLMYYVSQSSFTSYNDSDGDMYESKRYLTVSLNEIRTMVNESIKRLNRKR